VPNWSWRPRVEINQVIVQRVVRIYVHGLNITFMQYPYLQRVHHQHGNLIIFHVLVQITDAKRGLIFLYHLAKDFDGKVFS
jgi:hypothetical protein